MSDEPKTGELKFLNRVFEAVAAGSPYGAYYVLPFLAVLLAPVVMVYVFVFMPLRTLWRLAKRLLQP